MKLVPDTSVVIDGRITTLIDTGEYNGAQIIIPEAVVAELEAQANQGREIGFSGLTELQELCKLAEKGIISIEFYGERPTLEQVKLASGGEIDSLIRRVAITHGARFITSDVVQSEVAKAKGLDVLYLRPQVEDFTPLAIDQFFDEYTIAVYLKERAKPMARKGTIGKTETITVRETLCTEYELRSMAQEILERAKRDPDGFIEIEKRGVTVVQIGSMRISIARRPFSDGMEITAVRPIVDLGLPDYAPSDVIKKLLKSEKPGILITGTPGCGKTTLAQAIATYLSDSGCIVKTMEQPREMQVPDQITQYTALDGSMVNTADVMLLVRPDFVIFDELRKNEDFDVFADM
ncbi:MAG: Flp pilus assembly complex ATPase component TadA, partial [Methanospirillum sp.]|uniref:ATPase, T2SS/T4P/T4SS family n=1 Tax=Methanospirillum sp. TaxID=45200 RepID=UPI00236F2F8E